MIGGFPINQFTIQTYLTTKGEWYDDGSYPTITEAVSRYKFMRSEYPESAFRIIQILEVEA